MFPPLQSTAYWTFPSPASVNAKAVSGLGGPRSTRRATRSLWWALRDLTCRRQGRRSPSVDPGGDVDRNIPTLSLRHVTSVS